ncbi:MAG: hypothetical protein AB7F35_22680 [Acetobacteraceae bacterium]
MTLAARATLIRVIRFASLLLVGLVLGLTFAHVLEMPGKLRLPGPIWLVVQQNLYVGFGAVGAVIEPAGILLSWALVLLLRGRAGFGLALTAAITTSAGLAVWAILVAPMNAVLNGWTPASLPSDWMAVRNRWELGHAIHALLFAVAFSALATAAIRRGGPVPPNTGIGSSA